MTTTAFHAWRQAAAQLVEELRTVGALRSDAVAGAMVRHGRHLYLPAAGPADGLPDDPDALMRRAYTDDPAGDLTGTRLATSRPSAVAKLLEAADLHTGQRVLSIDGDGGWTAALAADLTGHRVDTVVAYPGHAVPARRNLAADGCDLVAVHQGDGYAGAPGEGPFDTILATVGIAGVPPVWIGQLTRGDSGAAFGTLVVPLAHGGMHPLVRISMPGQGRRPPVARLVALADFTAADGQLYAGCRTSPATRAVTLPEPRHRYRDFAMPGGLEDPTAMADLWMYLAARDHRTTRATSGSLSGCALVSEDERCAVLVQGDGLHLTDDTPSTLALAEATAHRIGDWIRLGRPPLTAWSSTLDWITRDGYRPLWMPTTWTLDAP
jgi:protein-L-isoaspartate(D-aspartate) O-methyltransferase